MVTYGEELNLKLVLLSNKTNKYVKDFECGNKEIDSYFKSKALQDDDAISFIFIDRDSKKTVAVYSLSCSGIIVSDHNKIFLYPAVEIKYFAVNTLYQHMPYSNEKGDGNLSDYIFDSIIVKIIEITENCCGAARVVLYSVPKAVNFYKNKHGFKDFTELMHKDDKSYIKDCVPLFLPLN